MKREAIFKIILVLIMGVVLFAKPVNVFAVESNPTDINDFFEDQGSLKDIQGDTTTDTNTDTNTNTNTNTNTSTNTTTSTNTNTNLNTNTSTTNKTDLPKAGLAEDTMMVVSIVALVAIAIYAFKKVNDYKNI